MRWMRLMETSKEKPWMRYRDKRIVYQASIRAAKYGTSGHFTLDEWLDLCKKYNHACAICHAQVPLTADHVIPLVRGGTNHVSNIQPLCKPCNSRKGHRLPDNAPSVTSLEQTHLTLPEQLRRFRSHARHRIVIDVDKARKLAILARQGDISIEELIENLIEHTWQTAIRNDDDKEL